MKSSDRNHLRMKAGDRACMCPHLEAFAFRGERLPHTWKQRTSPTSWALVCADCADTAALHHRSLKEQIQVAREANNEPR